MGNCTAFLLLHHILTTPSSLLIQTMFELKEIFMKFSAGGVKYEETKVSRKYCHAVYVSLVSGPQKRRHDVK